MSYYDYQAEIRFPDGLPVIAKFNIERGETAGSWHIQDADVQFRNWKTGKPLGAWIYRKYDNLDRTGRAKIIEQLEAVVYDTMAERARRLR